MIRGRTIRRAIAALLTALLLSGVWAPSVSWAETKEQLNEVRQILEEYHLSKPSDKDLNQTEIDKMVESLHDPYTQYFDDEEWKSFASGLEQNFTGIGIVLVQENGRVYIEEVIAGSPAEKAGFQAGDVISAVNGKSAKGLSISDLQGKLRGIAGTSVTVGVDRNGKALTLTAVRQALQLPAASGQMMGEGVGYLALTGFTTDAGTQFAKQLDKLEKSGMTSLVIDLRNNGGGYVTAAQKIAGLFVKNGVLAHLKDRDGNDDPLPLSGGGKPYPVTILVNGYSASASELLAGALQDYGVAKLVGTKTYGKGVVQSIIPLQSGGVIKVTVQEYFTPKGRKVDKTGLQPDQVVEGAEEQLIEAYRDSGGTQLAASVGKGTVVINGVRTTHPYAAVQQANRWYVSLRLAAALTGASVGYDAKTKSVTVSRDGKAFRLKSGDGRLIYKNGWNLIDLSVMEQWFPSLTGDAVGGLLNLSVR